MRRFRTGCFLLSLVLSSPCFANDGVSPGSPGEDNPANRSASELAQPADKDILEKLKQAKPDLPQLPPFDPSGHRLSRCEVFAVAEDRAQALGDGASRRLPSGKVLVDLEALEPALQPLRPRRIGVAVGDEGAIFERNRLSHGRPNQTDAPDYG
jgi:hypothetical protein